MLKVLREDTRVIKHDSWIAVKNILKYLRSTKDMFLIYDGDEELVVKGYTDATFVTDLDDFRPQSMYVFTLKGDAVSLKSSKKDIVADSTTVTEYITALKQQKGRLDQKVYHRAKYGSKCVGSC